MKYKFGKIDEILKFLKVHNIKNNESKHLKYKYYSENQINYCKKQWK